MALLGKISLSISAVTSITLGSFFFSAAFGLALLLRPPAGLVTGATGLGFSEAIGVVYAFSYS